MQIKQRRDQPRRLFSSSPSLRGRITLLLVLTLLPMLACLWPATAQAQSCWINGAASLDFGEVTRSRATDAQTTLGFQCQSGSRFRFRVCVFIGEGNPSGYAPRRMTNYNGAFMNYDLYSNPARTRRIGPLGTSPVYSLAFRVPGNFTPVSGNFRFYGRVPAGQTLPAAFPYQGLPAGSVMRYSYGTRRPSVADCRDGLPGQGGGSGEVSFGWSGVNATYANACRVVVATDLDFGNARTLASTIDQISTVQLQCPTGTPYRVGLDNGINNNGNNRRMASGANRIAYELYRNSNRTQRWGSNNASDVNGTGNNAVQALTVYGRVPAQATPAPGSYADTITVTLTY